MGILFIVLIAFGIWWIVNDWDRSIPPGFDEALRNAERDHGTQDEDEK